MRLLALLLAAAAAVPAVLITHGPRDRPWIALTFDADMTPGMVAELKSGRVRSFYDEAVVRELRATRTPATIFMTGLWAEVYPRAARALARDPLFELENHSYDHYGWEPPCYGLPVVNGRAAKRREVVESAAILRRIAGIRPRFFRFPGGCENPADVRLVASLGEQPVQWDVVSGDAFLRDPKQVEHEVLTNVRPGSIVVMHLVGPARTPATAPALRVLIPELRARGYRFVTLRRLLR